MAFDWNGYLQIARDCAAQPEDEGLLRTAISRAYYAAYHAAKSYVEQVARIDVEGQTDSHKVIWDALKTGPGSKPQLWKPGNELKRAPPSGLPRRARKQRREGRAASARLSNADRQRHDALASVRSARRGCRAPEDRPALPAPAVPRARDGARLLACVWAPLTSPASGG